MKRTLVNDWTGIDIDERIAYLMDIREFLLKQYNPMIFPPQDIYVNSLPIAQFEGILTNVERRLQLYIMVQTWAVSERWQVKFWYINLLADWNAFPKNEDGIQIIFRNFNMTTARACIYKHEAFSTMHVQRGDVMVSAPTMNTRTIR